MGLAKIKKFVLWLETGRGYRRNNVHDPVPPKIQTRAKRENRRLDLAHCRSIRASARPLALAEASARCAWAWSGRGGSEILRWRR
jgi:hypothetical protein